MQRQPTGPPFQGRADELERLLALIARTSLGRAGIGIVGGPTGIGRTTILARAASLPSNPGLVSPTWASIDGGGRHRSLDSILDPLRTLVGPTPVARCVELIGALAPGRSPLEARILRKRAVDELAATVVASSSDRPMVVVVDDLDRSPPVVVDLVEALAWRLVDQRRNPLVIVAVVASQSLLSEDATSRGVAALVERLSSDPLGTTIVLGPLDDHAVDAVLADRESPAAAERSDTIKRRAAGNPLSLRLLSETVEMGAPIPGDGDGDGPVVGWLRALEPDVVRHAARWTLVPGPLEPTLAAAASGLGDPEATSAIIERAIEVGLLSPSPAPDDRSFRFGHELIESALGSPVAPWVPTVTEAAAIRSRVSAALPRHHDPDPVTTLARGLLHLPLPATPQSPPSARAAADAAIALGRWNDARSLVGAMASDEGARPPLEVAVEQACLAALAGDPGAGHDLLQAYRRAAEHDDATALGLAAEALAEIGIDPPDLDHHNRPAITGSAEVAAASARNLLDRHDPTAARRLLAPHLPPGGSPADRRDPPIEGAAPSTTDRDDGAVPVEVRHLAGAAALAAADPAAALEQLGPELSDRLGLGATEGGIIGAGATTMAAWADLTAGRLTAGLGRLGGLAHCEPGAATIAETVRMVVAYLRGDLAQAGARLDHAHRLVAVAGVTPISPGRSVAPLRGALTASTATRVLLALATADRSTTETWISDDRVADLLDDLVPPGVGHGIIDAVAAMVDRRAPRRWSPLPEERTEATVALAAAELVAASPVDGSGRSRPSSTGRGSAGRNVAQRVELIEDALSGGYDMSALWPMSLRRALGLGLGSIGRVDDALAQLDRARRWSRSEWAHTELAEVLVAEAGLRATAGDEARTAPLAAEALHLSERLGLWTVRDCARQLLASAGRRGGDELDRLGNPAAGRRDDEHAADLDQRDDGGLERTILVSDVVGSTDVSVNQGDQAYYDLVMTHHHIVRRALAEHGGVEFSEGGDSLLAWFSEPEDALDCALAVGQGAAEARRAGIDLQLRVGMARGRPFFSDGRPYGSVVNRVARLVVLAKPGQLALDEATLAVAGPLVPDVVTRPVDLRDFGPHTMGLLAL